MPGKIIYTPNNPPTCGDWCEGLPRAVYYSDGTIWQCSVCGKKWVRVSGAQYNEPYATWWPYFGNKGTTRIKNTWMTDNREETR